MKYMGSKRRIAKHILPIMLEAARFEGVTTWVEPFVGGANMIDKVPPTFKRIGSDLNAHTIEALIAIRDLVDLLPEEVSEEYYQSLKGGPPEPVSSWVRFVCSFGSKFEAGLARGVNGKGQSRNHALESKNNALGQSPQLQGVRLINCGYSELIFTPAHKCLVYCDPPYVGTTSYKTESFDHSAFWQWCRDRSKEGHIVFVSEYSAPEDFYPLWQGEIGTNFASGRKEATHKAVEKLFRFNDLY